MTPAQLAKLLKRAAATSKVEGAPGGQSRHFTKGNVRSPEFNAAHQSLLQDPSGTSIAAKHLGMIEPDGPRKTAPGYWEDSAGVWENPTTEYPSTGPMDRQALKAKIEQTFMAQDGVANTGALPGLRAGQASTFRLPEGTDPGGVRKQLDAAGFKFDDDYFLSPGSDGLDVGAFGMGDDPKMRKMQQVLGNKAQPMHRLDDGANAYRGGGASGWDEWTSPKQEFGSLIDEAAGMGATKPLDAILRETAGQAPEAYQRMEGISGGTPRRSMETIWDSINSDPKKPATEIIRELIKNNKSSMQQGMQYLQQQQPQGLLA